MNVAASIQHIYQQLSFCGKTRRGCTAPSETSISITTLPSNFVGSSGLSIIEISVTLRRSLIALPNVGVVSLENDWKYWCGMPIKRFMSSDAFPRMLEVLMLMIASSIVKMGRKIGARGDRIKQHMSGVYIFYIK